MGQVYPAWPMVHADYPFYRLESETTRSAVYEVPVVRDPLTKKVINLLPTTGIIYNGDPSTAGLDAGFEFGPEGTIFNTYWSANKMGQRPGGRPKLTVPPEGLR